MTLSRPVLVLTSVAFGLAGFVLGSVLAFWQAARLVLGPVTIPWGLIVALTLLVGGVRLAVNAASSRWAGSAVFTGWLAATIIFATQTPWAGDLIISSGPRQLAYLLGGVIVGSAAASIRPRLLSRPPAPLEVGGQRT